MYVAANDAVCPPSHPASGNGYLREAALDEHHPDYAAHPLPPLSLHSSCTLYNPAPQSEDVQLSSLPQGVLEDVLARCTLRALFAAAIACKALHKVCDA